MRLLRREISDDAAEVIRPERGVRLERADEPSVPLRRPAGVLRRLDPLAPSETLAPGCAALLDRLRAHAAQGTAVRALVFAAPTASPAVAAVLDGLAAQAELLGLRVVRGELRGVARPYAARGAVGGDRPPRDGLTVGVRPTALDSEVRAWLGQHRDADLILIEGPPLLGSIDAALVARACDGLILIAERGVTERDALRTATNRGRVSGCALLGVVVAGADDAMPTWMQRVLGARPRPLIA